MVLSQDHHACPPDLPVSSARLFSVTVCIEGLPPEEVPSSPDTPSYKVWFTRDAPGAIASYVRMEPFRPASEFLVREDASGTGRSPSVRLDASLETALRQMREADVTACPVFDEKGVIAGVLTLSSAIDTLFSDRKELLGEISELVTKSSDWLQKMEELLGFSRSIRAMLSRTTLESSLLESGVQSLCRLIGARYGAIGMLDGEGTMTQFLHTGMDPDTVSRIGSLPEGKGLLGVVIREDRPIRLDHIGEDPRSAGFPSHHPKMESLLAVPISSNGKVYGRIYLSDKVNHQPFTMEDEKLVLSFAHSLSLILDNAREMEQLARTQARLLHLAMYDPLTDLPNRKFLHDTLEQILAREGSSGTRGSRRVAFLFIDLDNFKFINDSRGHQVGDQVLKSVGKALQSCVREHDIVSRIGGDEFAILVEDQDLSENVTLFCQRVLEAVVRPIPLSGQEVVLTASIGVALYPDHGSTVDALMKNADLAMYHAKNRGKNSYSLFSGELAEKVRVRHDMENHLRQAITQDEFVLFYQPKINLRTGEVTGVEALIRWPRRGISPGEFIPVAEESGLIVPIGEWVVKTACQTLSRFRENGYGHLIMGINLSVKQFWRSDFPKVVREALEESGCLAGQIEFEVTESQLMTDIVRSNGFIRDLKSVGVRIAVDDFGTGYSSLAYLKHFDIDSVKIDQSFIRDLTHDASDRLIVRAIIAMAHGMRLGVLAEGVETAEQLAFLHEEHCDEVQGYFLSRPLPEQDLWHFLRSRKGYRDFRIID